MNPQVKSCCHSSPNAQLPRSAATAGQERSQYLAVEDKLSLCRRGQRSWVETGATYICSSLSCCNGVDVVWQKSRMLL